MFAESYLHGLIAKVCPINGLRFVAPADTTKWPNTGTATTADGLTCVVDVQAGATSAQISAAQSVITSFNCASVESARQQLDLLDCAITNRMMIEAFVSDASVNPSFCGGAGGTSAQHVAWVHAQKATLRAALPQ
jgi:hypothetical protein